MIRYYQVREKDAFIAGVQTSVGAALSGGTPEVLEISGQPTELDELAARRTQEDRVFSLTSLSILNDDGPTVTAQDTRSGCWVKVSPRDDGEFIIEEVSG
jgi:hypothetical protein